MKNLDSMKPCQLVSIFCLSLGWVGPLIYPSSPVKVCSSCSSRNHEMNWFERQWAYMCQRAQRGLMSVNSRLCIICTFSLAPSLVRDTSLQPSPARMLSSVMFLSTTSKFISNLYAVVLTTEESRSIDINKQTNKQEIKFLHLS